MNALPTLRSLYDTVKNTKGWLVEPFLSEKELASIADKIIREAEGLQRLKAERIADLEKNGPKVYFELETLCITLLRDGKEVFYDFIESCAMVCATNKPEILRQLRIVGPPDESGMTYYIGVRPEDYETATYGIYITKAEGTIIDRRIREVFKTEDSEDK